MESEGLVNEGRAEWTKVWVEALSSSGIGTKAQALRKVIGPVVLMAHKLLLGKSWLDRTQGLTVLMDVLHTADLAAVNLHCGRAMLRALQLLPGRIWKGNFILIYICNFHVLSHLLLIYICKFHWNLQLVPGRIWKGQDIVFDMLSLVFKKHADLLHPDEQEDSSTVMVLRGIMF